MLQPVMTYKDAGVDYDAMDPFKRAAQMAARNTAKNILRLNNGHFKEVEASRGESAYLIETPDSYLAHVEEGLGTKNLVADAMYELTGKSYYDAIAQDTVAMIVNDMITLGAMPLSVAMHLAVGDSEWFGDENRSTDLIEGWRRACDLARCTWGGGETPTLKGCVVPGSVVLSGSASGVVMPKQRLIKTENIRHGDSIILVESNGIHANGLTLARRIAERQDSTWTKLGNLFSPDRFPLQALPQGYLTKLEDGRTYGETLLDPTHIYVGLVEDCLEAGVKLSYVVNVTGHGWRKLMRAPQMFAYIIDNLPRRQPIFDFIQKYGPMDDYEAYGNLNMGVGLALIVSRRDESKVISIAASLGLTAIYGGHVEMTQDKCVVITSKNLTYSASTLGVR